MDTTEIVRKNSGIRLDIGCGGNKQEGFVGIDARNLPGVDIVHNVLKFPWPLESETVLVAVASHLLEHILPSGADPKLLGLIQLLLDTGTLTRPQVAEYIGIFNDTPNFILFMNEVWRVMRVGGEFAITVPHGRSDGFLQDPSHCGAINEARWAYFDPFEPYSKGVLWGIYKPLPWHLKYINYHPEANIEVILRKRSLDEITELLAKEIPANDARAT